MKLKNGSTHKYKLHISKTDNKYFCPRFSTTGMMFCTLTDKD